MKQLQSTANMVLGGAAVVSLLTIFSRSKSLRFAGSALGIGGSIYAGHQMGKVRSLEFQNNQLIDAALAEIEVHGLSRLKCEPNPDAVRRFLELVLRLGAQATEVINTQGNRLKKKSLLSIKNRNFLLNLQNVSVIRNVIRLNSIIAQIDKTKKHHDAESCFKRVISVIDKNKLAKEARWAKLVIGSLVVIGILAANIFSTAAILFWFGIGFWVVNYFYPVFSESRKLKHAVNDFINSLQSNICWRGQKLTIQI
jgi:hypothetical protein